MDPSVIRKDGRRRDIKREEGVVLSFIHRPDELVYRGHMTVIGKRDVRGCADKQTERDIIDIGCQKYKEPDA